MMLLSLTSCKNPTSKNHTFDQLGVNTILLKTYGVSKIILFLGERESYAHQGCIYVFKNSTKMAKYMVK